MRRAPGLAMGLLLGLAGCAPEARPPFRAPALRLTELVVGRASEEPVPLAGLGNDWRPVLRRAAEQVLYHDRVSWDPEHPIRIEVAIAPALRGTTNRVGLTLHARTAQSRGAHHRLSEGLYAVEEGGVVELPLRVESIGDSRKPQALDVYVAGVELPPPGVQRIETRPVEVPAGAQLTLAYGLRGEARREGPVRFRVRACEAADCRLLLGEILDPRRPGSAGWHDRRVDLAAWAGRRASFVFEAEPVRRGATCLPLWGAPIVLVPQPGGPGFPDVILVSLDTLAAGHLDAYGYPRQTAPYLTRLAERGTLFENAVSAATTTAPSHVSLFTSLPPSVHGVVSNTILLPLAPQIAPLPEILQAAGFETAAFTEAGAVGVDAVRRGFDRVVENPMLVAPTPGRQSAVTFGRALDWLTANRDVRSFAFVHTYEVHTPYLPPEELADAFASGPAGLAPHPGLKPKQSPELYDREILHLDRQLEAFVEGLRERGLLDHSLLVITSDHGEEFFQHGHFGHGTTPHQEVVAVPLLLLGAGIAADRRIATPVGLIDVLPTLLELLGLPPRGQAMGRSLAGLVRGGAPEPELASRLLVSEAWLARGIPLERGRELDPPTLGARRGSDKLVRFREGDGFRYQLYDLERDPAERDDRAGAEPARVEELANQLRAHMARVTAQREALGVDPHWVAERTRAPGPEERAQLRALGYLD